MVDIKQEHKHQSNGVIKIYLQFMNTLHDLSCRILCAMRHIKIVLDLYFV